MTVTATHPYIEALARGSHDLPHSPAGWLNARRAQALERANALTVPTTRDEEWRFTDITPLTKIHFQPARSAAPLTPPDIARFVVPKRSAGWCSSTASMRRICRQSRVCPPVCA